MSVLSVLPPRPDLDQLRHQAKDLLRAAQTGDPSALARIAAVSGQVILAGAQLAVAREHGFPSWARLKIEVERRAILDRRDVPALTALLAEHPELATEDLTRWRDHPHGAGPINYAAMLRVDTTTMTWREVVGTGAVVRALLAAGAPVNGRPEDRETPLITAASYGDAEAAAALVEAGADLETHSAPNAGGIPDASALAHAAIYGHTAIVDLLVAAGARVTSVVLAAAAGDLTGWDLAAADRETRILAMIMAADHQRLAVIDQLIEAGTPFDTADATWHRHPLRLAAENARPASVRHLLALGADPDVRDERGRTALDLCRFGHAQHPGDRTYEEVARILEPVTSGAGG
jgi:uncharacterized protein